MYKPGQLLTINHKVYRVKHTTNVLIVCKFCDARETCFTLCAGVLCKNVPYDCYLQLIKPKSSNDGKN